MIRIRLVDGPMQCKCGGKLQKQLESDKVWICTDCKKEWDLDFSLFPIVEMAIREIAKKL